MKGCPVAGGDLIDADYGKPLLWIGLYIAGASLLCAAAMAIDAFLAFRHLKSWFPCRLFSLNATSLALLAIATKLPVDLNTPMPQSTDQLTKLSGTVLLCTATGNFLPSLGDMDSSTILSNVIALAILVITVIVNIIIQISTGVIYVFVIEHVAVIALLILLLIVFVSSAIAIPAAKENLENDFDRKIGHDEFEYKKSISLNSLQLSVKKVWLMAHSASPQYVISRSVISAASGFFSVVAGGVLIEALLRGLIWKETLKLCRGTSDYSWSTIAVLVTQCAAILIGTMAPAIRWLSAVRLRRWSWKDLFLVEDHWIQLLVSWRESPLKVEHHKDTMKILYLMKIVTTESLIFLQKVVVLFSKAGRLLSIFPLSFILNYFLTARDEDEGAEDLGEYVLLLKGEEEFVRLITQSGGRDVERWIQKGVRKRPSAMEILIRQHSSYRQGFTEVGAFLPAAPSENCWALPLVTLAAIAAALFSDSDERIESLLRAVGEGLRYVRLVDKHLDTKGLVNMRKAADMVWMDVRLHHKWLDAELIQPRGERLAFLNTRAQEQVTAFEETGRNQDPEDNPRDWPEARAAAVCMRDCTSILLQIDGGERFERLRKSMADILGACLTNLPHALFIECFCNKVEVREKRVRNAARILGEAEEVLRLLETPQVGRLFSKPCIDDWLQDVPAPSLA